MINLSYPAQILLSVWSAPRTSQYLRMTKRDPRRRDWNMIIYPYVSWGNVVSVWPWEKGCFFLKLRFLLRERICFNGLHWLPAGQRVDFKMHSDTFKFFIARLPYIYVLIREPLSYYRPGKNLLSLQILIDHVVFLTLKSMSIFPFPLLLAVSK